MATVTGNPRKGKQGVPPPKPPTSPTTPGTTPAISDAELRKTLDQMARDGIANGSPRNFTIAAMVLYILKARPGQTPTQAFSLANAVYEYVLTVPSGFDKWIANVKLPGWAQGLAGFLADLTSSATWIRVLLILGGLALIAFGMSVLFKSELVGSVKGLVGA